MPKNIRSLYDFIYLAKNQIIRDQGTFTFSICPIFVVCYDLYSPKDYTSRGYSITIIQLSF